MICNIDGLAFEYRTAKDRYILQRVVVENIYGLGDSLRGQVVVDVGAHIGGVTVRAAAAGARVVCFEPESSNLALLRTNIAGNRQPVKDHSGRATGKPLDAVALGAAISNRSGIRRLFLSGVNTGCHTIFNDLNREDRDGFQDVMGIAMDEALDHYAVMRVDFLKLDCEGGERYVLPYVAAHPERFRSLGVEFHDEKFREEALRLLANHWHPEEVSRNEWRFTRK